jgi:hypothetical protein
MGSFEVGRGTRRGVEDSETISFEARLDWVGCGAKSMARGWARAAPWSRARRALLLPRLRGFVQLDPCLRDNEVLASGVQRPLGVPNQSARSRWVSARRSAEVESLWRRRGVRREGRGERKSRIDQRFSLTASGPRRVTKSELRSSWPRRGPHGPCAHVSSVAQRFTTLSSVETRSARQQEARKSAW